MRVLELLEAKSETYPWAKEFIGAIKAFKLNSREAGSSDGQWVAIPKAETAVEELKAAGFKQVRKGKQAAFRSKESPKKGLTFVFDDEDAIREKKTTVFFWDETMNEALLEERNPKLKYTETKVKDKLDKVMVTLEGNDSASMTRLLNRYARLDKTLKSMTEQRDKVNAEVRTEVEALFNAEDEVLSRVVETLSATVMLTKAQKAATKEKKKSTDFEAIVRDLTAAVPDLAARIAELTEKYTKFEEPTDTVSKVQIKPHVKESVLDSAREWGKRFLNSIKTWAAGFDKNLASIKSRIEAL